MLSVSVFTTDTLNKSHLKFDQPVITNEVPSKWDDSLHHHVNFLWAELRIHTSQQQFILPSAGCSCWTAYSANTAWDERAHFRHRALLLDLVRCTVYLYLPVHLLKFSPPCCSVWSDKSEGLLLCDGVSLQGQRLSLSLWMPRSCLCFRSETAQLHWFMVNDCNFGTNSALVWHALGC